MPAVAVPEWCARFAPGDVPERAFTVLGAGCERAALRGGAGAVVFDGYLFDRCATARELDVEVTASAAALVAAAYERWGTGAFNRLDGAYLAAIWDGATGRCYLGHDGLGQHPAFYRQTRDGVWLSPNVLRLTAPDIGSVRANRLSLALLGLRYWPEAGETFFDGVHRLRPGHYLEIDDAGRAVQRKHWDLLPDDDEPWLSEAAVLAEFEPALSGAVSRAMQLEPGGIMLSGGVDSVTIAALASAELRRRQRPPLVAVSGRNGGPLSYEEEMQSRVVQRLGLPHVISTTPQWLQGHDLIRRSLEVTAELPAPGFVYWLGAYTGFYRLTAAGGVRVLLTGSGGDNWLSVGDAHAADLLRRGEIGELIRFVRSDLATGSRTFSSVVLQRIWTHGMRPIADTAWDRIAPAHKAAYHRRRWVARLPDWLSPDRALRTEIVERLLARRTPARTPSGRRPGSYYRHALRSYSNPYMHHENETAHHVNAMCGVRLVSPYHDRRLVEFFMRIPPRVLYHGDRYKGLLRPVLAKHLPDLGLEEQKKTYPAADQRRALGELRQSLGAAWPDYSFARLGDLGVVDPAAVRREGGRIAEGDFEWLGRMFGLLGAEHWLQARGL